MKEGDRPGPQPREDGGWLLTNQPTGEFTLPIPTSPQLEHQVCQISGQSLSHSCLDHRAEGGFP